MPSRLRIALYTHDTFGLGHVRRSLRFLSQLSSESPEAALLLVTGSPALGFLRDLPPRTDVVKIPTLARTGASQNRPPHLPLPVGDLTAIRERLIREAVLAFEPDVFLVDNFPLGSREELRPILEVLETRPTRTVLGLRDILDAPDVVRRDWIRHGTYDVLDRLYDRILVYGAEDVFDVAEAYAVPSHVSKKIVYCGYVTEPREANAPPPSSSCLLATGGGGGDALPLLSAFLDALSYLPAAKPSIVLTGPLMGSSDRAILESKARSLPNVSIRTFEAGLGRLLEEAEVVVSMCGYNTTAEILAHGAKAVVVPRTWKYGEHEKGEAGGREWEQLLRARALATRGLLDVIEPEALTPQLLAERITARAAAPPPPIHVLPLDGVARVSRELLGLATRNGRQGRTGT
ncbi:MAG TPA: glycosyltransferase [Candidatus Eisenbacteria bacterium]|nr:glycosyltransferase [Candidatus Eisenbacteria bacterium]